MTSLIERWSAVRATPARALDGRLTDLYLGLVVLSVPVFLAVRAVLPDRYQGDARTIQRVAQGTFVPVDDTSFLYVGRLYAWLGLADAPVTAGALGVVAGLAVVGLAVRHARGRVTPAGVVLLGLTVLLTCVYLGQFSKDVWVLPVVVVVLLARPSWRGELGLVLAAAAYAATLRNYWFLVIAVYLALRVTAGRSGRRRWVLAVVAGTVVGATIVMPAVLGADLQSIRGDINDSRGEVGDVASIITSPQIGGGPAVDAVENVLTVGELVAPVPLALLGSPVYLAFAVGIGLIWAAVASATFVGPRRLLAGVPPPRDPVTTTALRAALLLIAYLTVLSFFEPDYGSYVRHLTPVLPLVLALALTRRSLAFRPADGPHDPPTRTPDRTTEESPWV
ncbi:MAG: hypothetical protein JWQ53_2015 [Klenkia sp.]|nr:hypothetical protein [Klenkia sp.]